jgi:hypothetical protein
MWLSNMLPLQRSARLARSGDRIVRDPLLKQLVVRARGGVELAMLQTRQTQPASDIADPVAQSFQTIAVHYVVVIILMIAARGQLDADIAAVECCL